MEWGIGFHIVYIFPCQPIKSLCFVSQRKEENERENEELKRKELQKKQEKEKGITAKIEEITDEEAAKLQEGIDSKKAQMSDGGNTGEKDKPSDVGLCSISFL